MKIPTKEQTDSISFYTKEGYTWDIELSTSLCGVVLKKGDDIVIHGLDGSINYDKVSNLRIIKI